MKKFTKLFLSCMAVSAITAAVATSAMAEAPASVDIQSSDGLTGKATITASGVTITDLAGITPKADTQVTFLVFKGTDQTTVTDEKIKGIDQGTTVQPANSGLKSDVAWSDEAAVADATYTVMVGYTNAEDVFAIAKGTFVLTESKGEPFIVGDVNGRGNAPDSQDATLILKNEAHTDVSAQAPNIGKTVNLVGGGTYIVGDVNGRGSTPDSQDATLILKNEAHTDVSAQAPTLGTTVTGTIAAE